MMAALMTLCLVRPGSAADGALTGTVGSRSIKNPAAVYCVEMGYEYRIQNSPEGHQYGVCVLPNRSVSGEWDFYRGKNGREFSYCARYG